MTELAILQKIYDLINWYVPLLNRLPRNHKFLIGNRMINLLYDLLEGLVSARYVTTKLTILQPLKSKIDILRYQGRLLLDFGLISMQRYEYASKLLTEIGVELEAWIKQQQRVKK